MIVLAVVHWFAPLVWYGYVAVAVGDHAWFSSVDMSGSWVMDE